ncbi:MAG: SDR family NAD(P)-dependent oxidoreductase [Actinobacteria bacterium]|nr:SDR family NAD(P)-dependent oxidoreductase [Actinomycetota bacterium]
MTTSPKTALVTGASRGIGAEIARSLDRAGYRVALAARNVESLDLIGKQLRHSPVILPADLSSASGAEGLASDAIKALGRVDVLVNNAGSAWRGPTTELTSDLVDTILATNVRTPLLLIARLIPFMKENGGASVINLSSVSGVVGTPNRAAYAASKGAVDAMTRSLAIELGPFGIRVNSVAPGVVDTDLWAANRAIPGVIELVEQQIPLRRWSTSADVADVVVFLAGDGSRYLTGETLCVDGGMARTRDLYSGAV